jgi:hypothetical protein
MIAHLTCQPEYFDLRSSKSSTVMRGTFVLIIRMFWLAKSVDDLTAEIF